MKRKRRDAFDEPTLQYEDGNVPVAIEDGDDTRPVDVEEMEVAARRSKDVEDPHAAVSLPTIRTAANAVPRPYVELVVAGAGMVVSLPVYRVTQMGVVLTIPPGNTVDLAADTPVTAVVHLMRTDEELTRARVPAHVAHTRVASADKAGGLSLRWDLREASARTAVEALLGDPS